MEEDPKGVETPEVQPAPVVQPEEVVDYKAELEKAQKDRDNYKQGLLDAKDILKGKGVITDPEDIAKIVDEKVKEGISQFTLNFSKSTVDSTLASLSSSEDERKLIQYHYENSIVKSGLDPQSVRNDLENAKLLANKKALFKEAQEMKIALNHKQGISTTGQGSGHSADPTLKSPESFFSKEQIADLKKRGWSDDKIAHAKELMLKKKD